MTKRHNFVFTGPEPFRGDTVAHAAWEQAQREAYWNPSPLPPAPVVVRTERTWKEMTEIELKKTMPTWRWIFTHVLMLFLCKVFGHSKKPLIVVRGVASQCARCREDLAPNVPLPWSSEELHGFAKLKEERALAAINPPPVTIGAIPAPPWSASKVTDEDRKLRANVVLKSFPLTTMSPTDQLRRKYGSPELDEAIMQKMTQLQLVRDDDDL